MKRSVAIGAIVLTQAILITPSQPAVTPQVISIAKTLLQGPQGRAASITLSNGTVSKGQVLRVTDESVTIRERTGCASIDLRAIQAARWEPVPIPYRVGKFAYLWSIPLFPIAVAGMGFSIVFDSDQPILGSWVAVDHRPDGAVKRVQFERPVAVFQEYALTRTGRYQVDGDNIAVQYDDQPVPHASGSIRFGCGQLFLDLPDPICLNYAWRKQNRPYPPIVGRWRSKTEKGTATVWEFRADGTFISEKLDDIREGRYQTRKNGELDIQWRDLPDREHWKAGVFHGHLLIAADGRKVAYKKTLAFR